MEHKKKGKKEIKNHALRLRDDTAHIVLLAFGPPLTYTVLKKEKIESRPQNSHGGPQSICVHSLVWVPV